MCIRDRPIITLVLAFIVLITGLAVDQRRNEIAVIRSRGATPWQVVGFAVVEGVVLGLLALVLGALLALALTRLIEMCIRDRASAWSPSTKTSWPAGIRAR